MIWYYDFAVQAIELIFYLTYSNKYTYWSVCIFSSKIRIRNKEALQ